MKLTFDNPDQVLGAVKVIVGQYEDNVKAIDEDKCLNVSCVQEGNLFKVTFSWASEIRNEETIFADDYFKIHNTKGWVSLEKYVFDSLKLVTAQEVLQS